jgi:hypothetical protein
MAGDTDAVEDAHVISFHEICRFSSRPDQPDCRE